MKQSEIDVGRVLQMYGDGISTYVIAKELNTYPNMINRILKKNGARIRDKSAAQKASLESGISIHPTLGKPRSDAVKLTLSKKSRDYWKDLEDGEKQRRIDIARERWNELPEEKREEMRKLAHTAVRLTATEGSRLEKILLLKLKELGYNCQHHRHIIENDKMEVDLYIPTLKVAIEIDGPSHFLPIWGEDKLKKAIESDNQKNGLILSNGFIMIRIKCKCSSTTLIGEKELIDTLDKILKSIENEFPANISDRLIEVDFE